MKKIRYIFPTFFKIIIFLIRLPKDLYNFLHKHIKDLVLIFLILGIIWLLLDLFNINNLQIKSKARNLKTTPKTETRTNPFTGMPIK